MATHPPQPECRETTRSLLSTSATAPVARRLADKAMSISRHPAQLLRPLPVRVQQPHSRQRPLQRRLTRRLPLQQLLTRLRQQPQQRRQPQPQLQLLTRRRQPLQPQLQLLLPQR